MIKQYKVGGHAYQVIFAEGGVNNDKLLESSKPFETEVDDSELLFRMFVDDKFRPETTGKEVGQFDSGGNNNGVYIREDGSYVIRLSDYAHSVVTHGGAAHIHREFASRLVNRR